MLAVALHISPREILKLDTRMILTLIKVLNDQAKEAAKG